MNCTACTKAASLPLCGEYMDKCISCEGRRLVGAMDVVKRTIWQRAHSGDSHAQQVCSQAKHWAEHIKKGENQ